ncbi:MAG: hypothetical protein R2713_09595 [Ilumatobacteraceae bacterium]
MIAGFALREPRRRRTETEGDRHRRAGDARHDRRPAHPHRPQHRHHDRTRPRRLRDDEIVVVSGYEGPAYGIPDQQTVDAIHLAARTEGMLTDPVYEGKSMAGMIGMIRSGEIPAGSKVLYCHLGGQPALSAYAGVPGLGS